MMHSSSVRTLCTPLLEVAYWEAGPVDAPAVVLLHGWPDSPRTWMGLAQALALNGHRVIVPWLRGFGPTRFLQDQTPRSAQFTALAQDFIDLLDGLGLDQVDLVGHDWGARAAYSAACLWPHRVRRLVALSVAWGTNQPTQALSHLQSHNYWYHWFMHLPRGQEAVREDRDAFTRYLWQAWSPGWAFSDDEFTATAADFHNPDWADITLHSYTHRWGAAASDPHYEDLEVRLRENSLIHVPTLHIHGEQDGANGVATTQGKEALFTAGHALRVVPGCGHFPQREHPSLIQAMVEEFLAR
jgi:pimeloyl-ACP methyl ester carboxylesterase